MDFEKAYQNFLNGSATPEEIEFVRSEMNKARTLNDIIDNVKRESAITPAEKEQVKKAIKNFNIKDTVKTLIIVGVSLIVLAAITLGAIFIPMVSIAKDNLNVSRDEAKELAISYVANKEGISKDNVRIVEFERELEVEGRIKNARYVYSIELYNGSDKMYEIDVDAKTGKLIVEVDD